MTRARNNRTEAVRLSIEVTDFIRFMAKANGIGFKEMTSKIVREWAEENAR